MRKTTFATLGGLPLWALRSSADSAAAAAPELPLCGDVFCADTLRLTPSPSPARPAIPADLPSAEIIIDEATKAIARDPSDADAHLARAGAANVAAVDMRNVAWSTALLPILMIY